MKRSEVRALYNRLYAKGCRYEWGFLGRASRGWYKDRQYIGKDAVEAWETLTKNRRQK